MRQGIPYQPFYCEENIWSLIRWPQFTHVPCGALFISNPTRSVAMSGQRGGFDGWVIWDYHVVLLQGGGHPSIWDPNSLCKCPEDAQTYLELSFPEVSDLKPEYRPQFRLVPRTQFLNEFKSDRRHMRQGDGRWRAPPPQWPPPAPGHTLPNFIKMEDGGPGLLMDLTSLRLHPWCTRN